MHMENNDIVISLKPHSISSGKRNIITTRIFGKCRFSYAIATTLNAFFAFFSGDILIN